MKQKNYTKRALCMSVLSMLLCCSMLIGTTFAWFTDSVTSGRNKIVAGNLDIALNYMNDDGKWEDASELAPGTLFNTDSPWEPGKVVYEQLQVVNNGSLAAKYYFSFRNVVMNEVLVPDGEGGYTYPTNVCDGEEAFMQHTLMDVLQVAYYPGTYQELLNELGLTIGNDRTVVEKAVSEGLISFFDEYGYNTIADNFELFGALAPAGLYKGEEGADDDSLNPVSLSYGLTMTNGIGDVVDDDGNQIIISVPEATDTQEYTVFLYWEPDVNAFWYDTETDIDDNDYNLNNGKVATPLLTEELGAEFTADCTRAVAVGELTQDDVDYETDAYWAHRAKFLTGTGKGTLDALEIEFDVYVEATQIPHESDSFDNQYDDEVNWPSVGDVMDPELP